MNRIYLDNAATTQVDKRVVQKMLPYFSEIYGNPSSLYQRGLEAKEELEKARKKVADMLNCSPEEIIFTGSGTESDNLAIFGAADPTKHILCSEIEHHAVLHPVEKLGGEKILVDEYGKVSEGNFSAKIQENTHFASIMYANNEIGTINDIPALAKIAREKEIIFHTDACQAGGELSLDTQKLGVDLMTLNGSKIHGPKGIGVLYKRKGIKLNPQILGGGQEMNLRAGTENLAFIVGFAEALKLAQKTDYTKVAKKRDRIIDFVLNEISLTRLNGHPTDRLSNNINFSCLNTEGESLLLFLDHEGIEVSTASACTSESLDPSHVLMGIGLPKEVSHGSIRISLSKFTTDEEVDRLLKVLPSVVRRVRKMSPLAFGAEDFEGYF